MKHIHVDEAIAQFRQCFDEAGLTYRLVDSSENYARLEVERGEVTLTTWFDADKQLWGFDLLQGGYKSCDKFDVFEDYFGTYLSIYTVFLPNARIVADAFEREFDLNTVYDCFSGNKQSGYTAKFRVLNADKQQVLVQRVPEGYLVRLVVPDEATQKYKIRFEYKYEINDEGVAICIPTMSMLMKRFADQCSENDSLKVHRLDGNAFLFVVEDLNIRAQVYFNYMEVRYHVFGLNEFDADLTVTPEDPLDISTIYMACKDSYDDLVASADVGETDGVAEESDNGQEVVAKEQDSEEISADPGMRVSRNPSKSVEAIHDGFSIDDIEELSEGHTEETYCSGDYRASVSGEVAEVMQQEEVSAMEGDSGPYGDEDDSFNGESEDAQSDKPSGELSGEHESPDKCDETVVVCGSEAAVADGIDKSTTSVQNEASVISEKAGEVKPMQISSIKRVLEDGELVSVQFIADGNIYVFGVEAVKAAGIPVKRIKDSVDIVYKCGIRMTKDELSMKTYSDDPDEAVLTELVAAVFS